jgi:phosphoribosyl 1,2-cyclic phosphate phosphodiesterase
MKITMLGCGPSTGVPAIGPDWGACDPATRATGGAAPRC